MSDRLTDADLVRRLKLLEAHQSTVRAALAEGCKTRAFQESIAEAKARGLTASTPIVDGEAKLKAKVKLLEVELAAVEKANLTAEKIRETIYGLSTLPVETPAWAKGLGAAAKSAAQSGVPVVFWSDWHWGEVVAKDQVGGVNSFNRAVAERRVRKLVDTTIDLCFNHMTHPKYPGVVVCLGGDFITGAIHEELAVTNWGTVQQQFIEVQGQLEAALRRMADAFGKVFVVGVVGNHGRDTVKPRFKNRVLENYEWNLYCQLERTFKADKRFLFQVPEETDALFSVCGHRFLLTHGDCLGVGGGDGIIGALGPITRGTIKVGRSEAQIGRDFDTLLMGHWHTYIPRGEAVNVIVNGSLKGYDEYARLKLRVPYSRPSQALWFMHPEHGVTAQWNIYLEPARKPGKGEEWVSFNRRT
jgi:hypothetical protein